MCGRAQFCLWLGLLAIDYLTSRHFLRPRPSARHPQVHALLGALAQRSARGR